MQEQELLKEVDLLLTSLPIVHIDGKPLADLLKAYKEQKYQNENKGKILRNIREEFLKYNWKDANPIQTYNQIKSLYESIFLESYEE